MVNFITMSDSGLNSLSHSQASFTAYYNQDMKYYLLADGSTSRYYGTLTHYL